VGVDCRKENETNRVGGVTEREQASSFAMLGVEWLKQRIISWLLSRYVGR